jgi:hypothetical protein
MEPFIIIFKLVDYRGIIPQAASSFKTICKLSKDEPALMTGTPIKK